jgi:hypothetical protein
MGLFDKMQKSNNHGESVPAGALIASVVAFAKLDLNYFFRNAIPAMVKWFEGARSMLKDLFDKKDCNYQDAQLVERFIDQIPGMAYYLSKNGYIDGNIAAEIDADYSAIYDYIRWSSRPKGAHPCNELIHMARLLLTILFGVRIINQHFLDGLQGGIDSYYAAAGPWATDIPRNAVERAVLLKQQYFPDHMYNREQWDLNKFQDFPLVAPVPDPEVVGKLYTGEFLGITIQDGYAIGDIIPDLGTDETTDTPTGGGTLTDENPLDRLISFVKANPVPAMLIAAGLVLAYDEDENE